MTPFTPFGQQADREPLVHSVQCASDIRQYWFFRSYRPTSFCHIDASGWCRHMADWLVVVWDTVVGRCVSLVVYQPRSARPGLWLDPVTLDLSWPALRWPSPA